MDLNSEIDSFVGILRGVSNYLANYNRSESLLNLISTFDGNSYVDGVKSHLEQLILELDGKMKYEQIIAHLNSLVRSYNQNLDRSYENFKKKLTEHKSSLEGNIKKYIQKICTDLSKHSSCVKQLINKICKDINNLCRNKGKLSQFDEYDRPEKLMKPCIRLQNGERGNYEKIVKTNEKYKQCLENCYSQIKCGLYKFMCYLRYYNCYIIYIQKSIDNYDKLLKDSTIIYKRTCNLKYIKSFYLDKFDNYMSCFQKLDEIGKHITTMKFNLKGIEIKVDEKPAKYIKGLSNITINSSNVQQSINKIKNMNNLVIARMKIARHTIDFYNLLQDEISKINDVEFHDYDFTQYLTVKGKLESFESAIKKAINKIKGEINKIENHTVVMDSNTYKESYYKNLISQVETFIDNSLQVIDVIKYLLPKLEYNKNQSVTTLSSIKSKVDRITKLNGAPSKLADSVKELKEFVKLQQDTKFFVEQFSKYPKLTTLSKYTKTLGQIINDSNNVISLINYYSDYLTTIGYVDNLIRWINSCYSSRFREIKGIINKFNLNLKEIIGRLETINKNLCLIKTLSWRTSVENNLLRLKEYMTYLKAYIRNSRENFNVVNGVIDKIKKDISKIVNFEGRLKYFVYYIECYIKWIENCKKISFIVNYLKSINDKINEILTIKNLMIKSSSITRIGKIEGKLHCVETSISELECAIEGVARNLIGCSIQSL